MNLAKAVANAAAMLVLKAKNVAQVAEDTALQNRVITAATQCALSTSQLVACTKVLFRVCWGVNAADNLYVLLMTFKLVFIERYLEYTRTHLSGELSIC